MDHAHYSIRMFTRRRFLLTLGALGVSKVFAATYPFPLGVASGYPSPDGMVLWTRLAGLVPPLAARVRWEIAADDAMKSVISSGETTAEPAWGHSVHVEVKGLEPERWYWYRFIALGAESPVGRTRTAPAAGSQPGRLRFAFASCQQYEHGYYNAHRHIAADAPDLVAFLGDYIYESSWGRDHVRSHGSPEPYALEDYRARYALYRGDPDLQAAHAACPWVVTWDDHEVDNDYADDRPEDGMPREDFLRRRAAAYRAFYEHMPLPSSMRPEGSSMRLHARLDWGTLARLHLLDTRQYRSWQACPRRDRGGGNTVDVATCERLGIPTRSMLGPAQERWLETGLSRSDAGWNVIAQTTRMAQFDQKPGPGRRAWTDGWDGYPAARGRMLGFLSERKVSNPVVIGGDVHAFQVNELKEDFDDTASRPVASEIVGTSITSQGWPQERMDRLMADNPHVLLTESRFRGYTRVELAPGSLRADLRIVDTVKVADAGCSTLASFVIEDGRPGPQRA
jgi:alkaline phosphatase D